MAMVSLQNCYDRAHRYMAQGEYDKAVGICRHILQYYPQDLGTFQLLGQIHLERKQAQKARTYFRRVLDTDPENVSAHWGMGIAYQDEGKPERAIAEFEQALEIKPDLSDLRNQLLRLYTELYGAARAQLRLSRAGLGRLYVKGEMLGKAVEEFREVLKVDPSRVDVRLSLAEALWRSGEIADAARVCEQVLESSPNALKANLILGYVHIDSGRQQAGEELWRRAASADPNNTMARAVFEMAPMRITQNFLSYDAATLPDFDEDAWEVQRASAPPEEELLPVVEQVRPEEETVGFEEAFAAFEEEPALAVEETAAEPAEPFGVSWLDDLATGEGAVEEHVAEELVEGLAPFSLEGMDEGLPEPVEEGDFVFTLEEEEIVAPVEPKLDLPKEAPELPVLEGEAEPVMEPFSLEDLGLSAEEIAVLEEGTIAVPDSALAEAEVERMDLMEGVAPFSWDEDLDAMEGLLSQEGAAAPTAEEAEPDELVAGLEPFALDEMEAPIFGEEDEEEITVGLEPFSLDELGALSAGDEGAVVPGLEGFSLEDEVPTEGEEALIPGLEPFSFGETAAPGVEGEDLIPGLEPFSLDELTGGLPAEADLGALPGGLKPFSLDELGLEEPLGAVELGNLEEAIEGFEEGEAGMPAFSWQEPGMRDEPAFIDDLSVEEEPPPGGPSIFEKLVASRPETEALDEEIAAVDASLLGEEEVDLEGFEAFSLEELSLEEAPAVEDAAAEEPALEEIEAFSLEEFGLEEAPAVEEAAAEEPALEEIGAFSLEELGLEEAPAIEESVVEPFSLEELGLEAPVEEEPILEGIEPFSLDEFGLEGVSAEGEEPGLLVEPALAAAPAEEDLLKPFSLEELGLTPAEIADLGLGEEELSQIGALPEEQAPSIVEEPVAAVPEEEVAEAEQVLPVEEVELAEVAVEVGLSLDELRQQMEAHPDDETLRLQLASVLAEQGEFDEAASTFKGLIKHGAAELTDEMIDVLQTWIGQEKEHKRLHRLHRLLGDAYMKKGWYQQAINEYAWVLSKAKED